MRYGHSLPPTGGFNELSTINCFKMHSSPHRHAVCLLLSHMSVQQHAAHTTRMLPDQDQVRCDHRKTVGASVRFLRCILEICFSLCLSKPMRPHLPVASVLHFVFHAIEPLMRASVDLLVVQLVSLLVAICDLLLYAALCVCFLWFACGLDGRLHCFGVCSFVLVTLHPQCLG